jgi:hypothetical protein
MATRSLKVKAYRKSLKSSKCRGLKRETCRRTEGCVRTCGTKRFFCRRKTNRKYN